MRRAFERGLLSPSSSDFAYKLYHNKELSYGSEFNNLQYIKSKLTEGYKIGLLIWKLKLIIGRMSPIRRTLIGLVLVCTVGLFFYFFTVGFEALLLTFRDLLRSGKITPEEYEELIEEMNKFVITSSTNKTIPFPSAAISINGVDVFKWSWMKAMNRFLVKKCFNWNNQ